MSSNQRASPLIIGKYTFLLAALAPPFVITEIEIILCSTTCLAVLVMGIVLLLVIKSRLGGSLRDVRNLYDFEELSARKQKLYLKRKMRFIKKIMIISRRMNIKTERATRLFKEARNLYSESEYKLCWIVLEDIEAILMRGANLSYDGKVSGYLMDNGFSQ